MSLCDQWVGHHDAERVHIELLLKALTDEVRSLLVEIEEGLPNHSPEKNKRARSHLYMEQASLPRPS